MKDCKYWDECKDNPKRAIKFDCYGGCTDEDVINSIDEENNFTEQETDNIYEE